MILLSSCTSQEHQDNQPFGGDPKIDGKRSEHSWIKGRQSISFLQGRPNQQEAFGKINKLTLL